MLMHAGPQCKEEIYFEMLKFLLRYNADFDFVVSEDFLSHILQTEKVQLMRGRSNVQLKK